MIGRRTIIKLIAIAVALLLLYAAIMKLHQYDSFRFQLQKLFLLFPFTQRLVWLVPLTELSIAFLLLLRPFRVKALFAAMFLLSLYTVYLAWMLDKGFSQPCHCGEPISLVSLRTHIVINLVGVLATGVAVVLCGHDMKSMV